MGIVQDSNELYWTDPGSNITQNNSCMASNLPSVSK